MSDRARMGIPADQPPQLVGSIDFGTTWPTLSLGAQNLWTTSGFTLQKRDLDGNLLGTGVTDITWGSFYDIFASDARQKVYIATSMTYSWGIRVLNYDLTHDASLTFNAGSRPRAVAELGGNLLDFENTEIKIFDATAGGNPVATVDTSPDYYDNPVLVDGKIMVAARNYATGQGSKVVELDKDGAILDSWAPSVPGHAEDILITGATFDGQNYYVSSGRYEKVFVFDSDKAFVSEIDFSRAAASTPGKVEVGADSLYMVEQSSSNSDFFAYIFGKGASGPPYAAGESHQGYTQAMADSVFGGELSLWGAEEISAGELADPEFGIFFDADEGVGTLRVDSIEMEVFYTLPQGGYDPDGLPPVPESAGPYLASCVGRSPSGGRRVVLVGRGGTIAFSDDHGHTLTEADSGIASTLWGVSYGDGFFVTVGEQGSVLTSSDGQDWQSESAQTQNHVLSVAFDAARKGFVAGGKDNARRYRRGGAWRVGK